MTKEKKEVKRILDQLFEIHKVYKNTENNARHIMIDEKCEPLFVRLESLEVARGFSETFLVFGSPCFIVFNRALSNYSLHYRCGGGGYGI